MSGSSPVPAAGRPVVSVVAPLRNERRYVEDFLVSVLSQAGAGEFEVILADGMSDDGTRELLDRLAGRDARVTVIDNPGRIASTGLNAAIRVARGSVVIRMDAHTEYAPDYIAQCLAVRRRSGADNVGGPWLARGRTYWQSAIALAFQSPFSSGGARSHRADFEGEVDSVYLGCWSKQALLDLGLFDEELARNQDDELNLRLTRSGGRVWQSPEIRSWYYPRASLGSLFAQYAQYGYWKVRVIQKHKLPASLRHLVPGLFVAALLVLLAAAPIVPEAGRWLGALLLCYLAFVLAASLAACHRRGARRYLAAMPFVFPAFHLGYGSGFLRGVLDFVVLQRGGRTAFGELTR